MKSNADQVAADLVKLGGDVQQAVRRTVTLFGAELQRVVRNNASGRPGPEAPTGNYRRSINRKTIHHTHESVTMVGTNAPQGRRLEFGFTGYDAIGRWYDQPEYPHFGPAVDVVEPQFEAAIAKIAAGDSSVVAGGPGQVVT